MEKKPTIAFIGAGNMGGSLIGGLIADKYDPRLIYATNPDRESLSYLQKNFDINISQNNSMGVQKADVIVFAVKPPILKEVVLELADFIRTHRPFIISIVTGITSAKIQKWLNDKSIPIVRCMPNTPALVQSGVTALFASPNTTIQQKAIAESILKAVGVTLWVEDEKQMDVITALSGSGPAYFFLVMQALQEAGIKLGLRPEVAELLTVQTALGAARMAERGKDVKTLREQVTSPGGTTEQAIKILEQGHLQQLFFDAVHAAKKRANELADLD